MTQEAFDYDEYCEAKKEINEEPLTFDQWLDFNESNKKSRFWTQDLDHQNENDLMSWVVTNQLEGLVDEESGGIIGYINRAHIENLIKILNK